MATALISTIGRTVRDRLPKGKMTSKKMRRPAGKISTPIIKLDTLTDCKDLLDWSNVSFLFNIEIFKRT